MKMIFEAILPRWILRMIYPEKDFRTNGEFRQDLLPSFGKRRT